MRFNYENQFGLCSNVESRLIYESKEDSSEVKFSIVIPTYKRLDLLKQALNSLLPDYYNLFSVVIVDNCSGNECDLLSLVKSYSNIKVKVFVNDSNIGMFNNWNRAIELADTNWLTMLHDDDLLCKDFFEYIQKLDFYNMNGQLIYGYVSEFGTPPNKRFFKTKSYKTFSEKKINYKDVVFNNPLFGMLGVIYNKKNLISLGGFCPTFFPVSDYILNIKYIYMYGASRVDANFGSYRWGVNESFNKKTILGNVRGCYMIRSEFIKDSYFYRILSKINFCYVKTDYSWKRKRYSSAFKHKSEVTKKEIVIRAFYVFLWFLFTRFI